jgi:calcium/calmodulin-dependent protein kinase I
MPPEIVNHHDYDEKVDVWSAGIVTYVLLSGKPPFYGNDKEQVYNKINTAEANMSGPEWKVVSPEAKDFI